MKHDKTPLQLRSFATCNVNKLNYTQQPPRQAFNLLYVLMLYTATLWKIDIYIGHVNHWPAAPYAVWPVCQCQHCYFSYLLGLKGGWGIAAGFWSSAGWLEVRFSPNAI